MNNSLCFSSQKLALAVLAALSLAGPASALTYQFQVRSVGLAASAPSVPSVAPTLGAFSIASRPAGTGAFSVVAPTSNSPGAFTYSSSNAAIATVSGNTITPVAQGTVTIVAQQAAAPGYQSGSTSASFVVGAPLSAGYVYANGLTWTPHSYYPSSLFSSSTSFTLTSGTSFCAGTINGQTGWRLPTKAEALALWQSDAMGGSSRYLGYVVTSTTGSLSTKVVFVNLETGAQTELDKTGNAAGYSWLTCVR